MCRLRTSSPCSMRRASSGDAPPFFQACIAHQSPGPTANRGFRKTSQPSRRVGYLARKGPRDRAPWILSNPSWTSRRAGDRKRDLEPGWENLKALETSSDAMLSKQPPQPVWLVTVCRMRSHSLPQALASLIATDATTSPASTGVLDATKGSLNTRTRTGKAEDSDWNRPVCHP